MGINNDNNISVFEEKTTLIENLPLAKKSSNTFIDSNSKKIQELLINKILSVLISLLLSNLILFTNNHTKNCSFLNQLNKPFEQLIFQIVKEIVKGMLLHAGLHKSLGKQSRQNRGVDL